MVGLEPSWDWELGPLRLQFGLPAGCGSALWLAARHRRVRRTRLLMASDEPAYRLKAVALPGRLFVRRWRLALFEVDARPGDRAVCVVRVIDPPVRSGVGTVEVKGRPRPGGEVVAREPDSEIWWPAGRSMVGARAVLEGEPIGSPVWPASTFERPSRSVPATVWVVVAVAVALFVAAVSGVDRASDVEARAQVVTALVEDGVESSGRVTVRYQWAGEQRTAQVVVDRPAEAGSSVELNVDPEEPANVWVVGGDVVVADEPLWASTALIMAFVLAGVAVAAVVSARARPVG